MASMMTQPKPCLLLLLLLLQIQLYSLLLSAAMFTNHNAIQAVPCLPDQASTLLQFKRSFSTTNKSISTFRWWKVGTNCCNWVGVRCSDANGHVSSLDLGDRGLESRRLDTVLFKLTSLRYLNLGGNNFCMSEIPSDGFEQLTELTHLNLSTSNFSGQVPYSIGRLANLLSLDLSFRTELFGPFHKDYHFHIDITYPGQLKLPNLTSLLANVSSLRELHLSSMDLSNQKEWCNTIASYTPNLHVLRMPFCNLSGSICGSLADLHSLSVVDLQHNNLVGPFPNFFANFTSLSVLQLSYNDLRGQVVQDFFLQNKLVTIDLHFNSKLSGTLPNFLVNDNLENFLVGGTNFSGTIPSSISNLKSLKRLGLGAQGFVGEIPSSIGKLIFLNSLQVSGLQVIGPIPSCIKNLTHLEVLEFSNCGLSGPIPSHIGDLLNLRILTLYKCKFSGMIPPQIFNLTQLDTLLLNSNEFVGTMDLNMLSKLPNLFNLDLSNNRLNVIHGEYNSSLLVYLPYLKSLGLSSCNITDFPMILRHLNGIYELDLSSNQMHGVIPPWAWEAWKGSHLFYLNLSHNELTGAGYDTFLPLQHIEVLDISFNMFQGPIPVPKSFATLLDYSNNHFSSMPFNNFTQLGKVVYFKASRNNLSGYIPTSFCSSNLQFLDLSYNTLSGSIPSCLLVANALKVLNLKENRLHGKLPRNIKESCMLEAIDFSGNCIEGQLPRSLASCKNLEVLDIGNNLISDSFPCWMSMIPRLQVLVLNSNKFYGQVVPYIAMEKHKCEFPSLRILDIASNNFSGTLMGEWFVKLKPMMAETTDEATVMEFKGDLQRLQLKYQLAFALTYKGFTITIPKILRTLVFIDVSNNAFSGSIPNTIGELILVHGMNMSCNNLTGRIPTPLGRLKQLESLDLSSNELSGEIPQELASLDFLQTLNLSENKLEGRIPESPHFSTFSNISFVGNTGLCGPPLSKSCSDVLTPNSKPHPLQKISTDVLAIFLFAGLGFGTGFAIVIVVVWVLPTRKKS